MKTFSQLLEGTHHQREIEMLLSDLSDLVPGKGVDSNKIDRILDKMESIVNRSSDRWLKDAFALSNKFDSDDSSHANHKKYNEFLDELDNWVMGDD